MLKRLPSFARLLWIRNVFYDIHVMHGTQYYTILKKNFAHKLFIHLFAVEIQNGLLKFDTKSTENNFYSPVIELNKRIGVIVFFTIFLPLNKNDVLYQLLS